MQTGIERSNRVESIIQPPKFTDSQLEMIQGFVDGVTEHHRYAYLPEDLVVALKEKSSRLAAIKAIKLAVRFNLVTTENLNPPKKSLLGTNLKILSFTYRGLSVKQIARELNVSVGSVGYMRSTAFKKIGVNNFLQAVAWVEKYRKS